MSRDIYKSSWDELVSAVDTQLKYILTKDIAPTAKKILRRHIEEDIYGVYTPKPNGWVHGTTYKRRHVLERQITAIYSTQRSVHTLLVTSTAAPSPAIIKGWSFHNRRPGAFLQLLESGNMGIWHGGFARPAVSKTQQEYDNGILIPRLIQQSVAKRIGDIYAYGYD